MIVFYKPETGGPHSSIASPSTVSVIDCSYDEGFAHAIEVMRRFGANMKAEALKLKKAFAELAKAFAACDETRREPKRAMKAEHRISCMVGWDVIVLPFCNLPRQSYSTLPVYQRRFRRHDRVEATA